MAQPIRALTFAPCRRVARRVDELRAVSRAAQAIDSMIPRRGFFLVVVTLALWVSQATAQPSSRIPRIGYMSSDSGPNPLTAAFLQGLRELGWAEGQSIAIEYRWA